MHQSKPLNRRAFFKRALCSASALAGLPHLIPSRAWGQSFGQTPASERITLGCIGLGWMGGQHLVGQFCGYPGTQVLALCDVDGNRLNRAKGVVESHYAADKKNGRYKGVDTYKDFRELLARPDIDAVVIATPEHWHALQATAAAKAGKDIYCEKPLAYSIAEGKAIVDAVNRFGRVFQTGSQQRSDWRFRFACELVRNGYIGEVKEVYVNVAGTSVECYLPPEPIPHYLDWDLWLGPAPWRPYNSKIFSWDMNSGGNWRSYRDYSGGMMTDWGAHHYDIAQWGLGMDQSGPVEVTPPKPGEMWGLTWTYANGVKVVSREDVNGVRFIGTNGQVEANRGHLQTWPKTLAHQILKPDELHLYESNDNVSQWESVNHHMNWLRCLRTRQKPIAEPAISYHTLIVCRIGIIAMQLQKSLKWDPKAERFTNDDEANRLLSRPMRSPWHL